MCRLCETIRDKIVARLFIDPSSVSILRPFIYLHTRHHSDPIRPVIAASK